MRIIRYFGVVALLCAAVIGSQSALAAAPAPSLGAGDVLRGHFVQLRRLAGFAKPLRTEGSFVLAPGRGLIWHSDKPFDSTTIITQAGILQLANGQEAMRLSSSKLPGLGHLYSVLSAALSGNTAPLEQSFVVAQSHDADGWRIELKPRNPNASMAAQLKGLVLTGSHFVDSIEVQRAGADVDRITFSDQKIGKAGLTSAELAQLNAAAR